MDISSFSDGEEKGPRMPLLANLSAYTPNSSRLYKIIESHVMNEFLISSGKTLSDLQFNKSTALKVCRWCLVKWNKEMYKVYIEPEKLKGKSIKYLINKNPDKLNKFQKKLVEKCQKKSNLNSMVVVCNICHKKTKIPMKKPKKHLENKNEEVISEKLKKKRKKKKKDLCAGLNQKFVAKLSTSNLKSQLTSNNHMQSMNISDQKQKDRSKQSSNVKDNKTFFNHNKLKLKKLLNDSEHKNIISQQKFPKKSLLTSFLDSL